ncbi:MAG: HPr family phosphocarrier protein [Deltaproteobacteria bacterium]|nr:HPr family phosphocarrier protein [Deltaproteobacteria bacterium]
MKDNSFIKKTFTIHNRLGLHARAASQFVQVANRFKAKVFVEKEGLEVNGKSIMGVMMLAAAHGTRITVKAKGVDAREAVEALGGLIMDGFGEG